MRRPRRAGLSAAERSELWWRWRQGESLCAIGRALDRFPTTLNRVVRSVGGIPPPERKRSPRHRSLAEREEISRGLGAGHTRTRIAAELGRSVSTVCREVSRNGGASAYRATVADSHAWERATRPQACKLAGSGRLRRTVAAKLRQQWSPEQIAGWLRATFPDDARMQVSHETIYRSLFVQARGVLKKELLAHLRTRRVMRRSRHATLTGQHRGQIVDAISISERPPQVEDRAVPGHWEGDLLEGAGGSAMATLVERKSRFTMLVKVQGKDTNGVTTAVARQVRTLPAELRRSLTWDRGHEMAHHKAFTVATNVAVYFCDPSSPWQRGTNENTNRLLRQYFPKRTDLSGHSQAHLNRIARRLNQRPRKTLGFRTPADTLAAELR
jgi:IS30 family transposase